MKKLPLLILLALFIGNLQAQITAEFTSQPFDNCGGASNPVTVVFVDQSTSPGGPITDWLWDFDDGGTSQQSSPTNIYLSSGNHTVCLTVTNSVGESDTECKTNYVSISNIPICTILPPDNITCVTPTATIDGGLSTMGPNIIYEWQDANLNVLGTDPTIDVSAAGFYTLIVTETNNDCSAQAMVEVIEDLELPIFHIPVTSLNDTIYNCQEDIYYSADLLDPSCTNCSIEIRDGNDVLICNSLPCVYDKSAFIDMGVIVDFPFFLLATNNQNGCYDVKTLPTPNPATYNISNNITNESCNGISDGSIDLTASGTGGPYIYDWEDLSGTNDPLDRTSLTAGIYTLNVTDAFGCEMFAPDGLTYEVTTYPIADVSSSLDSFVLNCYTPSIPLPIVLDGSNSSTGPNLVYRWYDSNNILVGDSIVVEVFDIDNYYLIVTDTILLCSNTAHLAITITQDLVVPIAEIIPVGPINLTCSITSIVLEATVTSGNNFSYTWINNNGIIIGNDSSVEVTEGGNYELIVTNTTNGCSATTSIFITEDITPPIADAGSDLSLTCVDPIVTINGTSSSTGANITYLWLDGNNTPIPNQVSQTLSVSQPGVYTLVVTNIDNECTASDEVIVTEDVGIPAININATTLVCPGTLVTIDMIPGCLNCSIEILDGMGNPICTSGLPCEVDPADGPFQITLTDLTTGCQNVEDLTISVSNPIVIAQITTLDVSCFGGNDGAIDIDILGGGPNYTYLWSNNSTTQDQFNLSSGIYFVTILDTNSGCELIEEFEIFSPPPLEIIDVQITNVSCTGTDDGSIDIIVVGGTLPYEFAWSNASTLPNQSNLVVGTYAITITDPNGCILESPNYEVIQNACFNFANDTTICVGEVVPLSNDSSTSGWTYLWSPATDLNDPNISNPIASPSETTTYFLTITDGTGMVVFNGEGPTVTVQNYMDFGLLDFSNAPLCEGDSLELYGNVGLSFSWTGPNSFLSTEMDPVLYDVTELQAGIYSLTITDEFNCTAMADVDVFIDDDCVWPGDTDTNMVVNHFDLLNIGLAYDSVGTTRENASFDWFGQPSVDWSQTTPTSNVNYKHIDSDGNGIIEAADTVAITQNFGFTHNFVDPIDNQFTDLPPTDGFSVITPFYVEPDTLIEGETIALNLILGDVSNIVTGLYGIGFSIEYDSSIIVPGSASINFDNCWLGDVNADAISIQFDFPSPGRIDAAITRIDGVEMDGYGLFGDLIITLEDDILLWDGGSGSNNFGGPTTDVTADFTITNYHLINFSQEEIIVQGTTTTAPIEETTSLSFIELNELISVFPNPAKDAFFIASQKIDIERVRIFSATGDLKTVKTKTRNSLEFSTKELASGIYFIEIQTREGIVTKKLSIVE